MSYYGSISSLMGGFEIMCALQYIQRENIVYHILRAKANRDHIRGLWLWNCIVWLLNIKHVSTTSIINQPKHFYIDALWKEINDQVIISSALDKLIQCANNLKTLWINGYGYSMLITFRYLEWLFVQLEPRTRKFIFVPFTFLLNLFAVKGNIH